MTELETILHIKKALDELESMSRQIGSSELNHLIGASALAASDALEVRAALHRLPEVQVHARR